VSKLDEQGLRFLWALVISTLVSLSLPYVLCAESRFVRNGSLSQKGAAPSFTQEALDKLRADGWTCPDLEDWPTWWGGLGANMKLEYFRTGGKDDGAFVRISGKDGLVTVYYGIPLEVPSYVMTFWARGEGIIRAGVIAYELTPDRKSVVRQFLPPGLVPVDIKVNSEKWVRYRRLLLKGDKEVSLHPAFSVPEGSVDLDEVDIEPSNPGLDLIVEEELALLGTGALIENLDFVKADEVFAQKVSEYREAVETFRQKAAGLEPQLVESLNAEIAAVNPYVLTKGLTTVQARHYNTMLALIRVLNRLSGKDVKAVAPIQAQEAPRVELTHKPGVRPPRPDTLTITDIRSNKVRYDENEDATTKATIVNTDSKEYSGTLIARMILDLDTTREIGRTQFRIGPGETKTWSLSYNVGPETYGRAIEVRFVDDKGNLLDKWQEYYAVAAEYFRVHQHTYAGPNEFYEVSPWTTYFNQAHYFANEPTDFGVQITDAEQWISGQAGYHINKAARRAQIDWYRRLGVNHSFYQTFAFCGQMGYEEMRKHPEYVLYDENGQFAVDPIYGGYPNPMELASPIEIGPKRKEMKIKPYLDRKYTPWQHTAANLAYENALIYQTNCIKAYAKEHNFTGVYIDGNMGVLKGFAYDGTPNVPSGKLEDFARLGARNHRIFSETLKKENPNFGTWFNWGYPGIEWALGVRLTSVVGSGTDFKGDLGDENIRAATGWKNVMILHETGSFLRQKEGSHSTPEGFLKNMIAQRDFAVQKWGANTIIGYSFFDIDYNKPEPGPTKWAWPTVNYYMAQLIATQIHHAGGFLPSYRPALQFTTRYSRFIWAPDIKVVKDEEKIVQVSSPEEIWWKRLVYKRKRNDGYDLIVHLVRIPPTERWDTNWADEPEPLSGVKITVDTGGGKIRKVLAARPYHFEEEQQVVEKVLDARLQGLRATVEVPPFRYHTMVVFRIAEK